VVSAALGRAALNIFDFVILVIARFQTATHKPPIGVLQF
jgi:hypothetical protein